MRASGSRLAALTATMKFAAAYRRARFAEVRKERGVATGVLQGVGEDAEPCHVEFAGRKEPLVVRRLGVFPMSVPGIL